MKASSVSRRARKVRRRFLPFQPAVFLFEDRNAAGSMLAVLDAVHFGDDLGMQMPDDSPLVLRSLAGLPSEDPLSGLTENLSQHTRVQTIIEPTPARRKASEREARAEPIFVAADPGLDILSNVDALQADPAGGTTLGRSNDLVSPLPISSSGN